MSLLMDALRKAERDKKKAADRSPDEPAEGEDVTELAAPDVPPEEESTEPIQLSSEHESTEPLPRMPDMEATEPLPRPRSGDISLELEPLSGAAESAPPKEDEEGPDEFDWSDIDDATARRFRAGERTEGGAEPQPASGSGRPAGAYDQESTLPSERTIKSSLKDYFEASRSMERPSMRLVGTEQEPEIETGVRETTHVDAQTVFAAGESAGPPRFLRWAVAAVLLLAVTLGAVGFWYYYLTPTPRGAPSPRLVQSLPTPPPEPPAAASPSTAPALAQLSPPSAPEPQGAAPRPQSAQPVQTATAAAPAASAAPAPESPEGTMPASPETTPPVAKAAMTTPAKEAETSAAKAPKAAPPAPEKAVTAPAAASPATAQPAARSTLPAEIEVPPSAIQITHSKPAVSTNQVLTDAYNSFNAGQLDRAERLYRSVLGRGSDQRDALLGLAAIAVQRGQSAKAYDFYQRVLKLNPQDPVANAALATLTGGGSPERTEARLKMLLVQDPSDSYLHFALGNLYARQDRWPPAQQEYFDAYRLDDANADYAYNLAVSLDRLGSGEAALTYYRKALELADRQSSRFSTTEVMSRIKALSAVATTQ